MVIKNRLKKIRHELEIDRQTEMARKLGIQENQYNRYERNEIQPSLENALIIAKKLHRPFEEIFYIEENEPSG